MTMDNGEGRPLDEIEAGNEDPQGWYFDLPGGAWERQEEKNRTLRQRVLGNLSEDDAKARTAPFGRKPQEPEPEQKKGGRGFFGRRKKDDDPGERTSAGGTWVLNRSAQPQDDDDPASGEPQFATPDDDADDWSTEPPLKLSPFPRSASAAASSWGESDAGFDLAPQRTEATDEAFTVAEEAAAIEEDSGTEGFLASMRAWSQGSGEIEAEPEVEAQDAAQFRAPTYEEAVANGEIEPDSATEDPPLMLRPRQREDSEKQLDWDFGPAAWEEPSPRRDDEEPAFEASIAVDASDEEPAGLNFESMRRWADEAREADHPHFTVHHEESAEEPAAVQTGFAFDTDADAPLAEVPEFGSEADGDNAEESSLASMRRWAEAHRDDDHPHFAVSHHEADEPEEAAPAFAPIPLRPRAHDDAPNPSSFAPAPPSGAGDDAPRPPLQLPIVRRSHDQEEEPVRSEKWNEFFAINPSTPDDADAEGEDADAPLSDGLAAMRAWAQQRQEPDAPQDIPEEFLKPFDWELEEPADEGEGEPAAIPAEMLKPFDWETTSDDGDVEEPVFEVPAPHIAEARDHVADVAEPVADDPLDGIFPAAAQVAPPVEEKKKKVRFGRLFGRGKKDPAPLPAPDALEGSDWLPVADEPGDDIRVAAKLGPWEEDAGKVEAPEAPGAAAEGWGASLSSGWTDSDRDAFQEFSDSVAEPVAEWAPEETDGQPEMQAAEMAPEAELEAEPVALVAPPEDEGGWDPEPVATIEWAPELPEQSAAPADGEPEAALTAVATDNAEEEPFEWAPEAPTLVDAVAEFSEQALEPEASAEAVASVEAVDEPVAEKPWWEQPAVEAEEEAPTEAVASAETVDEPVAEKAWWEQPAVEAEEDAPAEAVASVEAVDEPVAEKAWWEQPAAEAEEDAPVEAVASIETVEVAEKPWWEQPAVEAEEEAPAEAVASVEAAEEPVAEKAWWEQPAVEAEEVPAEAVASVAAVEEPVAEKPWWEQPAVEAEEDAPAEAVASVEPVDEPVAEKAWWEQPAVDAEEDAPVEAVASIAAVDEPVAEKAWWEQPAVEAEEDAPVEAVASIAAVDERVAEKAWWEQPAVEADEEAPFEAAASVAAVDEPVAEKPWWEQPAVEADEEAPVEAVASVEALDEPVAEKPWWEQPAVEAEEEAPAEAVASVEALDEPVAEKAWWEQPAVEVEEAPAEAVASVDAVDAPVAEKPWWEQPAVEAEEAPAETVASVEAVEEPVAEKPWW
ncbi:MAG TPA: hypothetical protein PKI89_05635, partial [Tepidiformaceae bacterium]|nr:hypothetical protein [Tepidiformaceae bacterium]